jgi:large subunit ribosomal protein L10
MRPEKQYLVDEVDRHLGKSDYVFLANYDRISVEETAELRSRLTEEEAEFHVIKNSILDVAAKQREYPDLAEYLNGPTAIVIGGNNPPGVAKVLKKFFKDKDKVEVKVGILKGQELSKEDVDELADLPPAEVVKAQFLGLLNTPAQRMVTVLNAVPVSVVTVLKAYADKQEGGDS